MENKTSINHENPHDGKPMLAPVPAFDYIKCPLHRYTFSVKPIREWTERNCYGKTKIEIMIKRLIEKLKALRICAVMRSADDIQELYCGRCGQIAKQLIK